MEPDFELRGLSNVEPVTGTLSAGRDSSPDRENQTQALPPVDQGCQAWLMLAGSVVVNILIWGFAFSFGVLQEYYNTHEPFASAPNGIAAIGTTATGLSYLLLPIYFAIYQRWPRLRKYSMWAGIPLLSGSLLAASFANSVSQLIAFQGVLYAIGGNMLFAPTVNYLDEWFVRRKGLAVGVMWGGDGIGGVLMPIIMQALLNRYGFRVTLRALACAFVLCLAPLLFFVKPRLPMASASTFRPSDMSFMRTKTFWLLQAGNIVEALGYFIVPNYLPTYARTLGVSPALSSLTLILVNVAATIGCIVVGAMVDHLHITTVLIIISVGASMATFVVWGVSTTLPPLYIFSLLYGVTAGGYSTSWSGMTKEIQRQSSGADANMLFGVLAAGRGVGSIASGPLSEALLTAGSTSRGEAMLAYGSNYGALISFAGCTALMGGVTWMTKKVGLF